MILAVPLLLAALAAPHAPRPAFDLFASHDVLLRGNRVQCNINGIGELCADPTNSPSIGGGFWPRGTIDQYVFNQGIQVAGIIRGFDAVNFTWPGDTVGAYFFDPRGDQAHGQRLQGVFDALDVRDLGTWPGAARASDPSLFAPLLLGRKTVSDQDTWTRFWDGNPNQSNGRQHPTGFLVDERTMSFNRPGLEDAIFFVFRIINISARNPAAYQQLSSVGYDAAGIAEIAALGGTFQDVMERTFHVLIPDSGYAIDSVYVGFAQDADVGQAGSNFSNGNLVFNTTFAYKSDFREPTWQYPLEIFGPPFSPAPGFVAEALLRSPISSTTGQQTGMHMMSNTTGGAPFPDAVGVSRLWRNLSLNLLPSDGSCNNPGQQKQRHFCAMVQTQADTRVFFSAGPTTLGPGQSTLLVVAQVHAAPIIVSPTMVGGTTAPGLPVAGTRLFLGQDTLRTIDRVAGWVSHSDVDGDGAIEANEVVTTPRSLYWKIQAAQAAVTTGFLQPSAPEAPRALAVPGDGMATIVWEKSRTETIGDPYFAVASNPATPLYDPDFRQNDVEGYRVWRGRSALDMQVIAEFDYTNTTFTDYTGQTPVFGGSTGCVLEIGVTAGCPAFPISLVLANPFIQFRLGDRLLLQGGAVGVLRADTAVTGGAAGRAGLRDTGVPFVFVDRGLANATSYVYGVTAFDVNSVRSGRSSMESPMRLLRVTPRVASGDVASGSVGLPFLVGGNGNVVLDPNKPLPTLDPATAIFSGSMPPTNDINVTLNGQVPQLLADGNVTVTIDSIVPGSWFNSVQPAVYWFTAQGAGAPVKFSLVIMGASTSAFQDIVTTAPFQATLLDPVQAARFGGDSAFALFGSLTLSVNGDYRYTNQYRALVNGDPGTGVATGPRWWIGAGNENVADPNGINCLNTPAGFSCTLADLSRNAGQIPGIGIMDIASYGTIATTEPVRTVEGITSSVFRAADFKWYWGAAGAVDSVVDVVHQLRVPFSRKIRASWGILTDSSFTNVVNRLNTPDTSITRLTWGDVACVAPAPFYLAYSFNQPANILQRCGGVANFGSSAGIPDSGAFLMNHARLSPVSFASSNFVGLQALSAAAPTGNGFILYLDGHFFLMQMAGLPSTGTVWNLRTFAGNITGPTGTYVFRPASRPAAVPGLRVVIPVTGASPGAAVTNDSLFRLVHTVPDPYYLTNALETGANQVLRFVNLPSRAIIRIYSASGVLVAMVVHNDPMGGGEETWDLRSRTGRKVAAGVYFYHVETADGRTKIGRMTIVNRE